MACSLVTTSEHNINSVKKIYVNADGYSSGRLEEAYNNSITQEENHINMVNQAKNIFGFSQILSTERKDKNTFIHHVK